MKKIFSLLIIIFTLFIPIFNVKAVESTTQIGETGFYLPPYATFSDCTNGLLTRYEGIAANGLYYAPDNLITTGTNTDGMGVSFTSESLFVQGYHYMVTMLVGFGDENIFPKQTINKVCLNHSLQLTIDAFNSNTTCTNATVYTWDNVSPFTTQDGNTVYLGMISYIFRSPVTTKSFVGVMQSSTRRVGYQILGGVMVEQLSDNKTSISSSDVQNIIDNSGLASSESVKELQSEIENVKTEIENKTKEQIESQQVCDYIDKNNIKQDGALMQNGQITDTTTYGITDYIKIDNKTKIKILSTQHSSVASTCFYNTNKEKINCISNDTLILNNTIQIPDNTSYVRFSIQYSTNAPQFQICKSGNQALNDNINDLNQNISSDKVDGVEGAFESFEGFIAENSTITQLITMPITLYSSILNGLQSTCQPFVLGNLYGTNLTIPCINIGNYLGVTLWSMIDIIISGFAVFSISKKFIKIFNNFSSMKEGDVIDD